jgi:hypothetical protein
VKAYRIIIPLIVSGLCHTDNAYAEEDDLQTLKKQMIEMQTSLKDLQEAHRKETEALKSEIQGQQKMIEELQRAAAGGAIPPPVATPAVSEGSLFPTDDPTVVMGERPPGPPGGAGAFPTTDASVVGDGGLGGAPITLAGAGKSFLNISFDGMFAGAWSTARDLDHFEVGDHDPQQRGFNARNLEIALDGVVDPYFEGFANIVFKLDNNNETEVEVEEAFLQTTTLPWGLQLKGGQFFSPVGRNNPQHPHVWDFADAPLVNGRLLGPDGLRGVGVQAAWVIPLSWYSQLSLAVQNGQGGTGYSFRNPGEDGTFYGRQTVDRPLRGPQDFVFTPRWENSIDLSPTQTLLAGVSAAFGPNDTGGSARTQLYAADLFYKWKPANAEGGWPFVKWQSEAMVRRYEAGRGLDDSFPAGETFRDWGAYSQVVWGFRKRWSAGLRGDYLTMDDSSLTDDPDRQSRSRVSTNLTFYPSEFSKIRLQYNHDFLQADHFNDARNADSFFLQFEFALGAHGAHKF